MLHYDFSTVALMVIITVNGLSSFRVASLDVFQFFFQKRRIDGALYAELCVCHSVLFFSINWKKKKVATPLRVTNR
jgi:hypothetical protein